MEQLVETSQTRGIAAALQLLNARCESIWRGWPLAQVLDCLDASMDTYGLDALGGLEMLGDLARPRRIEIAAAINRLRSATLRQLEPAPRHVRRAIDHATP